MPKAVDRLLPDQRINFRMRKAADWLFLNKRAQKVIVRLLLDSSVLINGEKMCHASI